MSARTRFFAGGVRGRTHRSAPTRYGVVFRNQRGLAQDGTSSTGAGRSPPPTGDRRRSRRGAPGVWLPPAKFRNEIWGVGHGHRPLRPAGDGGTARRGRRALRVVAGRSHQLPGQRLAKRKARKEQLVKFRFCPIPSERSTAYYARKSQQSPARVPAEAASTEQDRLEPRPAARQGASRARNCAAKSVFSFDGSTAVFFLGRQKENGGWKATGLRLYPRLVNRAAARRT